MFYGKGFNDGPDTSEERDTKIVRKVREQIKREESNDDNFSMTAFRGGYRESDED